MVEISGVTAESYGLDLCAEAGAAADSDARALLDRIRMTREDQQLSLTVPPWSQAQMAGASLQIQAPADAPVALSGTYTAMRVVGISAPVHLSTTHARISVFDTTGEVEARANPGIIDFSGARGRVRLEADWEINLELQRPEFDGTLDAEAVGPVRVLLPAGFKTGFQVEVRNKGAFVCRVDIRDQIAYRKEKGRAVFTFGSGPPALRLISKDGPVVMDNRESVPEY